MFSGCKDNQTSADTYDSNSKQWVGAFTEAFIESLRSTGHNVAMPVLHRSICNWLLTRGYKQIPLYSASSNNTNYTLMPNKGNLRFPLNPSLITMAFNAYPKEKAGY
jgi:hypothetical protein